MGRAVKKIQDTDISTGRSITRAKSTGDGKGDLDDVILEIFVSHDSDIEPVVIKRKNSPFDSIMIELKL